jgi:hypothetical protein
MDPLLKNLKEEWEKERDGFRYTNVDASYWEPGQQQIEECPSGCKLEIYEQSPAKWGRVENRDAYRQTRICRKHGFARIYVITGPTAVGCNWTPTN